MTFNPLTLVLTILGGLIVAGILGWIRKPRLCVLVPRMFSYSQITDRGQLVEMTVFNRGFKTEESIEVTLNSTLKYEMLGSSSQDISLVKNKLTVSRLGASDEVAVILVVENGLFKPDDITQCLSKETKGTVASKLELVPMTASQRVGLITCVVLIPALFYGVIYGADYLFKLTQNSVTSSSSDAKQVVVEGWKINKFNSDSNLFKSLADKNIVVSTNVIARKRDITEIQIKFENKTQDVIRIMHFSITTSKSENKIPSYERFISDLILFPNKNEERMLKVVIPEKSVDLTEKTVFIDATIQDSNSDILPMRKDFVVN